MRNIPHPVAVITASENSSPAPSQDESKFEGCYGVTVSSFSTVTLGPPPIITFNLRKPSRTLDAILAQGLFRVHTLAGTSAGRDTAHAFVRLEHADAFRDLASTGVRIEAKGGDNVPAIWGKGVLASLLCRTLPDKMVEVGDHKVIIAEVLDMSTWEESASSSRSDGKIDGDGKGSVSNAGLLYVQQRYGSPDVSSLSFSESDKDDDED
jgi:flavin reductase (DIM6/NTAB) family NADH-FMN oxidoreductase RutF